MTLVTQFADSDIVRNMSGYPDETEVTPAEMDLYCQTADAKVKSDTNRTQLEDTDPILPLMISAANKQGAILVRLGWGDKEERLPILKDLYLSDIQSINQSGLSTSQGEGGIFVAQQSYKTRFLSEDLANYYLSTY